MQATWVEAQQMCLWQPGKEHSFAHIRWRRVRSETGANLISLETRKSHPRYPRQRETSTPSREADLFPPPDLRSVGYTEWTCGMVGIVHSTAEWSIDYYQSWDEEVEDEVQVFNMLTSEIRAFGSDVSKWKLMIIASYPTTKKNLPSQRSVVFLQIFPFPCLFLRLAARSKLQFSPSIHHLSHYGSSPSVCVVCLSSLLYLYFCPETGRF